MSKCVDADKLTTIIEERKAQQDQWVNRYHDAINQGISNELTEILDIITSLQQEIELPEKYQMPDWIWEDKTIDQLAEEYVEGVKKCNDTPTWELIHTGVCYGYELGKNARKEEE